MTTIIALLRGINVGGKHALPMKELAAILEALGASNPRTILQSGNAVFQIEEQDSQQLAGKIGAAIKARAGFEPTVMLLELEEIEKAIAENPFPEAETDPASLHVSFLASTPKKPDLEKLESLRIASERFHLADKVFYLHAPEGVGRSKLAAMAERVIGVQMTDRNWRTVCKIRDIARG